jgi:hypothetical protein
MSEKRWGGAGGAVSVFDISGWHTAKIHIKERKKEMKVRKKPGRSCTLHVRNFIKDDAECLY